MSLKATEKKLDRWKYIEDEIANRIPAHNVVQKAKEKFSVSVYTLSQDFKALGLKFPYKGNYPTNQYKMRKRRLYISRNIKSGVSPFKVIDKAMKWYEVCRSTIKNDFTALGFEWPSFRKIDHFYIKMRFLNGVSMSELALELKMDRYDVEKSLTQSLSPVQIRDQLREYCFNKHDEGLSYQEIGKLINKSGPDAYFLVERYKKKLFEEKEICQVIL